MTITATTTFVQIPGNGNATTFAFPMKVFAATDVVVGFISGGAYVKQTAGYSVTNVDVNGGGNVVFTSAPALGTTVDIRTQTPETQPTEFSNLGQYLPNNTTEALDRVVRMVQDLYRLSYQFGLHGADTESTPWPALPAPNVRAGGVLAFDAASGLPTVGVPNTQLITTALLASFLALSQTPQEAAAGVVPAAAEYSPWRGEDIRRFGAMSQGGFFDNTAALNTAKSVGASLYFPPGVYLVSSSLTLTVPCIFDFGAILRPANGATISINAAIDAGPWQIFDETLGGVIAGLIRPVNAMGRLYAEWWGAKGDGVTDDTIPWQAALRTAASANYIGIQMLAKQYLTTATLNGNGTATPNYFGPSIYGVGKRVSQFISPYTAGPLLSYVGGSGVQSGIIIQDVGFAIQGVAVGNAVQINGQCELRMIRCYFDFMYTGVSFYNGQSNCFTEDCEVVDSEFTYNCHVKVSYTVAVLTGGVAQPSNSFNGSGCRNCTFVENTSSASQPLISIGAGARPYNAPMDLRIAYTSASPVLFGNASSLAVSFYGALKMENDGGGVLTLGTTNLVPYAGPALGAATGIVAGTWVQVEGFTVNQDTTTTLVGGRKAYPAQSMAVGANTLASAFNSQHRTVFLRLTAPNYEYRYLIGVDPSGTGAAGYYYLIATYATLNTAGYGAPAFSVSGTGQLIVTNSSWPAATVEAYYSEETQSFGNESGVPNNVIQF